MNKYNRANRIASVAAAGVILGTLAAAGLVGRYAPALNAMYYAIWFVLLPIGIIGCTDNAIIRSASTTDLPLSVDTIIIVLSTILLAALVWDGHLLTAGAWTAWMFLRVVARRARAECIAEDCRSPRT